MHDGGIKVVALAGYPVEFFASLIKRLVGRPFLDQILATRSRLATDSIDERPVNITVADFQAYSIGPARQFFQRAQRKPSGVSRCHALQVQTGKGNTQAPLFHVPTGLLQHVQGNTARCLPACQLLGAGIHQHAFRSGLSKSRARTLQLCHRFRHRIRRSRIGVEQLQRLRPLRWRRQMIQVHLAQRIVVHTAGVSDLEQLFVGQVLRAVTHAPQQGQAIPIEWTLQGMAPGTVPVMLQLRLPGLCIGWMLDSPLFQRRLKGCLVGFTHLTDEGPAVQPIQSLDVRTGVMIQRDVTFIGLQVRSP